jgi:hypothetical protein
MTRPSLESLERLAAFVDCRMGDLVEIGLGGSIRVDSARLAEAVLLGYMKRADVGRREGEPDAVVSLDVEFFDKLPALALLLDYCVARDARLADSAERCAEVPPPRIEIPSSQPRRAASAKPKARPRCA